MKLRIAPLAAAGLAALAAINGWLLAVALEDVAPAGQAPVAAPEWTPKLADGDGMPGARPIGGYEQTLARPIFFKTREPYVPPPPPPPPKAPVARPPVAGPPVDPGVTVSGILIGEGVRKAYVSSRTDPRGAWVSEGDDLAGWKIKSVEPTAITLEQQERRIEVLLYPPR